MSLERNPIWLLKLLDEKKGIDLKAINERLNSHKDRKPEIDVSIIIPAFNEENNIINVINSISQSRTSYSFEIVIINNNSIDRTEDLVKNMRVRNFNQKIQGCGPSRQLGMENANGKIILLADADCFYSPYWLQIMTDKIMKDNFVCAYSKYSFINEDKKINIYSVIHRTLSKINAELRNINRPFLNAYGMSMAFPKNPGLEIGFDMRNKRGEDGRMCFDLMQKGKICFVRDNNAIVWTKNRVLYRDGSLFKALVKRIFLGLKNIWIYFTPLKDHNTKTS